VRKSPTTPSEFITWALVITVISLWLTTSSISGASRSRAFSPVGNTVSRLGHPAAQERPFLDHGHLHVALSKVAGRHQPGDPAPITRAAGWIAMRRLSSATRWRARWTAALTSRVAFAVAPTGVLGDPRDLLAHVDVLEQELVEPGPLDRTRKRHLVQRRRAGGDDHPIELCSLIAVSTSACPGSEQTNMCVVECTTPGSLPISSATRLTSTTSEMLPPQ